MQTLSFYTGSSTPQMMVLSLHDLDVLSEWTFKWLMVFDPNILQVSSENTFSIILVFYDISQYSI